jgi:hypothetical protein
VIRWSNDFKQHQVGDREINKFNNKSGIITHIADDGQIAVLHDGDDEEEDWLWSPRTYTRIT